jgi:hypothetical protein
LEADGRTLQCLFLLLHVADLSQQASRAVVFSTLKNSFNANSLEKQNLFE